MSSRLTGPAAWLLIPITAAAMVFILAPLVVTIAISLSNTAFVAFPPRGFTLQWYQKVVCDPEFLASLAFSAGLAIAATCGRCCSAYRPPLLLRDINFPDGTLRRRHCCHRSSFPC